jgi:hypothetical protein
MRFLPNEPILRIAPLSTKDGPAPVVADHKAFVDGLAASIIHAHPHEQSAGDAGRTRERKVKSIAQRPSLPPSRIRLTATPRASAMSASSAHEAAGHRRLNALNFIEACDVKLPP